MTMDSMSIETAPPPSPVTGRHSAPLTLLTHSHDPTPLAWQRRLLRIAMWPQTQPKPLRHKPPSGSCHSLAATTRTSTSPLLAITLGEPWVFGEGFGFSSLGRSLVLPGLGFSCDFGPGISPCFFPSRTRALPTNLHSWPPVLGRLRVACASSLVVPLGVLCLVYSRPVPRIIADSHRPVRRKRI